MSNETTQRIVVRTKRDVIIDGIPHGIGTPLGEVLLAKGAGLQHVVDELARQRQTAAAATISPEISS